MELTTQVMEKQEDHDGEEDLVNQCLGIDPTTGGHCTTMLPKGTRVCSKCRRRIDLASRHASRISSGNGSRVVHNSPQSPKSDR